MRYLLIHGLQGSYQWWIQICGDGGDNMIVTCTWQCNL